MVLRWAGRAALAVLVIVAGALGVRLVKKDVAAEVYRDRLASMASEYDALRDRYNDIVRRTAVTELLVEDDTLSVRVRTAEGIEKVIPTPFDPDGEIYVDYVVVDGRLWIRRVFDARTPPSQGVVIDPALASIDWSGESSISGAGAVLGKAVYRRLEEGRWVVTVTGDGSLGLARCDGTTEYEIVGPPPVREYERIEGSVEDALRAVTIREALERVAGIGGEGD